MCSILVFFFFSSRRRHTRSLRDWSSDVCSSDLIEVNPGEGIAEVKMTAVGVSTVVGSVGTNARVNEFNMVYHVDRSEERRVGKECRSRWSPDHVKKERSNTAARCIKT